jgi:geranylgeranyl diphosphate synthase type II
MSPLESYLEIGRAQVEEALRRLMPPVKEPPSRLHEAMAYSVFAGGKRLRPLLVIAAAEAVGGIRGKVMPTACALELIHTYSLIHDDLPCMDDDDLRRGRPTNHKVFGETVAVLAGDALLAHAFHLIGENARVDGVDPFAVAEATSIVGAAAGSLGMVGGQVADWLGEGRIVKEEEVEFIHRKKTGALIAASVTAGAVLAGADAGSRARLSEYGGKLGMIFQIADDILNVVGDAKQMGKAAGSDAKLGKATYPSVIGLGRARERAGALVAEARTLALTLGDAGAILGELAGYALDRKN